MEVLNISESCVAEQFFDHKMTVNRYICGICCLLRHGFYKPDDWQVNNMDMKVSAMLMVNKNNGTVNIIIHVI